MNDKKEIFTVRWSQPYTEWTKVQEELDALIFEYLTEFDPESPEAKARALAESEIARIMRM